MSDGDEDRKYPGVSFNRDPRTRHKYDMQLKQALIYERRLAGVFNFAKFEKVDLELKSESHQWEQTGNICIEYRRDGRPSGISSTEADFWVHELVRDGETLAYIMFPVARLKKLAKEVGTFHKGGGDGGRFDNVTIPLRKIWR